MPKKLRVKVVRHKDHPNSPYIGKKGYIVGHYTLNTVSVRLDSGEVIITTFDDLEEA